MKHAILSSPAESSYDFRVENHEQPRPSKPKKLKNKSYKCKYQELRGAEFVIGPEYQNRLAFYFIYARKMFRTPGAIRHTFALGFHTNSLEQHQLPISKTILPMSKKRQQNHH